MTSLSVPDAVPALNAPPMATANGTANGTGNGAAWDRPGAQLRRHLHQLWQTTWRSAGSRSESLPARSRRWSGPSGCGKTTLLRAVNRLHDHVGGRVEGRVRLGDLDVYGAGTRAELVRSRVGMVFQRPNPFPTMSIFDNVVSGLRFAGIRKKSLLREAADMPSARPLYGTWSSTASTSRPCRLSGGQQQRLCIARALAVEPEVLLMDEPCSALDPIATAKVEQLITGLAHEVTIVLVTHNMFQAARVSDYVAVLLMADDRVGELVEAGPAAQVLHSPSDPRTIGVRERPRRLRRPSRFGLYTAGVQISAKSITACARCSCLAAASEPMTAEAIAKDQGLPAKFLGVIMNDLRRGRDRRQPSWPRGWLPSRSAGLGDHARRRDPRPGRASGPGEGLTARDCDVPRSGRAPSGGVDSSPRQLAGCARARDDRACRER